MAQATLNERYEQANSILDQADQTHVLRFYDQLDEAQQAALLSQIESVDWQEVARLVETHVKQKPDTHLPERIDPVGTYPFRATPALEDRYRQARDAGETLLREGRVAAFTVAGGQGTRLGWDAPKGTFPATPIRKLPLFGVFAEFIRKAQSKYGATIPWYIMTSPINDEPTRAFFKEHDYFGLQREHVSFFPQGMMPAFNPDTGKVLMADRGQIALSPNGHGGSLKALHASGALRDMQNRGVEQISYTQVDNPNVKVVDPLFLGLHATDHAGMSSKALPKAYPKEKLGNLCVVDGKVTVIEYSDLPDELAEQRDAHGELRFRAGSIAIHAIRRDFIERLNTGDNGFSLPFHRADKKVPHLDLDTGEHVEPQKPNAVKLETFVFDALPMCDNSIVYETDRVEEFAPIKNAEGVDSPQTSREIQTERAARWLEAEGVEIPRDDEGACAATLEISHLTAIESTDLDGVELPSGITTQAEVLL